MFAKPLLAALLACALAAAQAAPSTNPWASMTRADVEFVYHSIQDNHPGAIDPANPYFKDWLERGYAQALVDADKASSLADLRNVLQRYFAGFADGHLSIDFSYRPRTVRWSGMILAREGERYRIVYRDTRIAADVDANAELIACDGRPIDAIIKEDLIPRALNNPQLEWLRGALANSVMVIDDGLPHPAYASCTIADQRGRRDIALHWANTAREAFRAAWDLGVPDMDNKATITEISAGNFWVRLPEFAPNADQVTQLKQLTARMPQLRNAALVVFDIRGNHGGDSQWGADVLAALFGEPYMQQLMGQKSHGHAEWRISKGNLSYLEQDILPRSQRQFGPDSDNAKRWADLARRMAEALARKETLINQTAIKEAASAPPAAAPLSQAKVALVTDYGCASSCLDFADKVLALPGAVHLGQTTAADTVYMEVRGLPLPSGLGRFVVSQKVYRGRARGHNEPYVPKAKFDGPISDTPRVQAWVMQQLAMPARP